MDAHGVDRVKEKKRLGFEPGACSPTRYHLSGNRRCQGVCGPLDVVTRLTWMCKVHDFILGQR